jgi:hypothetical protein
MLWHVDKYKITFKLVIDHWPRARYRAAARKLRNTGLIHVHSVIPHNTRVYPKVSGQATWSENCKW